MKKFTTLMTAILIATIVSAQGHWETTTTTINASTFDVSNVPQYGGVGLDDSSDGWTWHHVAAGPSAMADSAAWDETLTECWNLYSTALPLNNAPAYIRSTADQNNPTPSEYFRMNDDKSAFVLGSFDRNYSSNNFDNSSGMVIDLKSMLGSDFDASKDSITIQVTLKTSGRLVDTRYSGGSGDTVMWQPNSWTESYPTDMFSLEYYNNINATSTNRIINSWDDNERPAHDQYVFKNKPSGYEFTTPVYDIDINDNGTYAPIILRAIAEQNTRPYAPTASSNYNDVFYRETFAIYIKEIKIVSTKWVIIDNVEEIKASNVNVYPNPATDIINVSGEGIDDIKVYDLSGQIVMQTVATSNLTQLDISNLTNGIYLVKTGNTVQRIAKN